MKVEELTLNDIPVLSWEDIEKKYKFSEKDALNALKKGTKSCANFWTPYEENSYSEEETLRVKDLMLEKFPDMVIHSQNDPKYLEFYLDTNEKHVFMYSLITAIKKCKRAVE